MKKEEILMLLKQVEEGKETKLMKAMCLLVEEYENSPENLDPITRALIPALIKPLISKIEKRLGVEEF